jgi:hypothetical protein
LQARADAVRHGDERRITAALEREHDPPQGGEAPDGSNPAAQPAGISRRPSEP